MANPPDVCVVSIIVVSYNVAALLEECLQSILKRGPDGFEAEIIVVDNASQDSSTKLVRQKFPQVHLIENAHNYGFPRGCNQGLRVARGRYLFFLNPDAKLEAGALGKLVAFMDERPKAGIVGPQLRYPDGSLQPNRRRFPGRGLAFVESTILQRYRPFKNWSALKSFYGEDKSPAETQPVDWLVGAAFMVRREVVDQIGGLDEGFFMYSEELDFCRRAGAQGWQCWYLADAVVTHQEGRSSIQNVPQRHINFQTSKIHYYRKHYGPVYARLLRLFLLGTYIFQYLEESAKLWLGHKPDLRRERLAMLGQVLASGLRPYRSPYPRLVGEKEVCLLSAEYPPQPGGVGDYTACLAQALTTQGVGGVRVITGITTETKEKAAQAEANPVEVFMVNRVISPGWNWAALGQLVRQLQIHPAEVVVIQYQTGAYQMHPAINFLPLYLGWRMGANRPRVVTTFHDLLVPYLFPKAGPIRRWVNQLLLCSSDHAVVTNAEDYQKALEWGAKPQKVSLIPIGSNIPVAYSLETKAKIRADVRQSWGLAENDFAVGYFGLLNRSKGVDTLLEALAELRAGPQGQKWRLVIIGGEVGQSDATNRAYARELDALTTRLKLEDAIIRPGHLLPQATSQAFAGLDAMALPFRDGASFRRGSLLAPLAHGVPVVTTQSTLKVNQKSLPNFPNWPGQLQLFQGESVLYTDAENSRALAQALRQLHDDPALCAALSKKVLELSQYFSWKAITTALLKIL